MLREVNQRDKNFVRPHYSSKQKSVISIDDFNKTLIVKQLTHKYRQNLLIMIMSFFYYWIKEKNRFLRYLWTL